MDDVEIPESTVKAVAKRLKNYMEVERKEEGFDLTTSGNATGYFHSGRGLGGSYHYNRLQDKRLQHIIENPKVQARIETMGPVQKGMLTDLEKSAKKTCRPKIISTETSQFKKQKYYKQAEKSSLLDTTAKVLIQDHHIRTEVYYEKESSMNEEASEKSHSVQTSTSGSVSRKLSSGSLGSSGRKTSRSSSGDIRREEELKTPPQTPPAESSISSLADADQSTKGSEVFDGPSKLLDHQSSVPAEKEEISQNSPTTTTNSEITTETAPAASVPSMANPPLPTTSTNPPETMATPAVFQYNPQQPGVPIFYTLTPNKPPPGAHILTPIFHPGGMTYSSPLLSPGSPPEQKQTSTEPVSEDQEQAKFTQDHQTPQPEGESTRCKDRQVIMMQNTSVSTTSTADATTQTPVHVQTQTDKSALFKISERERKREKMSRQLESTKKSPESTKKSPESTKKIPRKTHSSSSEKLPQQSSLQPSPLAVKTTSRPTSSTSTRSSRTKRPKDASSKKQNESLLNTKVYSASQPNVADTTELRSRSGSGSSNASVSSRKSDSAVQKKKRVSKEGAQKKVAKGNIAKSSQKSSSNSVHSDVATVDSNKQVHQSHSPVDDSLQNPTSAAIATEPDALPLSSDPNREIQPTPPPQKGSEEIDIGTTNEVTQDEEIDLSVRQVPSETRVAGSTSSLVQPMEDNKEGQAASADATDKLQEDTEENQTDISPKPTDETNEDENQDITNAENERDKKSTTDLATSPTIKDEPEPSASDDAVEDKNDDSRSNEKVEGHSKSNINLDATTADSPNLDINNQVHPTSDATAKGEVSNNSVPDLPAQSKANDATSSGKEGSRVLLEDVMKDENPPDSTPCDKDKSNITSDIASKDGSSAALNIVTENNADLAVNIEDQEKSSAEPVPEDTIKDGSSAALNIVAETNADLAVNTEDQEKLNAKPVPEDTIKDDTTPVSDTVTNNEAHPGNEISARDGDDPISDSAIKNEVDTATEEVVKDASHQSLEATNEDKTEQVSEGAVKDSSAPASQVEVKGKEDPGMDGAIEVVSEPASEAVVKSETNLTDEVPKSVSDPAVDITIKDESDPETENVSNNKVDITTNIAVNDTDTSSVPEEIVPSDSTTAQSDTTSKSDLQAAPQPHEESLSKKADSTIAIPPETQPEETIEETVEMMTDKESLPVSTSHDESPTEKPADKNGKQEKEASDVTVTTSEYPFAPNDQVHTAADVGSSPGNNDMSAASQKPETVNLPQENDAVSFQDPQPESQEKPMESETEVSGNKTSDEIEKPASTSHYDDNTAIPESSEKIQESTDVSQDNAGSASSSSIPQKDLPQLEDSSEAAVPVEGTNKLPKESGVTNTETEPSDTVPQLAEPPKPDQSEPESISGHLSESQSQEVGSTATSTEVKDQRSKRITATTDGNDSSVTEVEEVSDVLTPVTDDADMSMESAAETDSSLPLPNKTVPQESSVVQPITIEPEQSKEGTSGSMKEEEEDDLEKISDISSTITATTAEESKESET